MPKGKKKPQQARQITKPVRGQYSGQVLFAEDSTWPLRQALRNTYGRRDLRFKS